MCMRSVFLSAVQCEVVHASTVINVLSAYSCSSCSSSLASLNAFAGVFLPSNMLASIVMRQISCKHAQYMQLVTIVTEHAQYMYTNVTTITEPCGDHYRPRAYKHTDRRIDELPLNDEMWGSLTLAPNNPYNGYSATCKRVQKVINPISRGLLLRNF